MQPEAAAQFYTGAYQIFPQIWGSFLRSAVRKRLRFVLPFSNFRAQIFPIPTWHQARLEGVRDAECGVAGRTVDVVC